MRNPKKRGENVAELVGGLHALSNGTVLPHYDCTVYVLDARVLLFFFLISLKSELYVCIYMCKIVILTNKVFLN